MSEPVLERSVLERKEREELQTIARAMGVEPAARARKADLIDAILSAAGITEAAPASVVASAEGASVEDGAQPAAAVTPRPRRRSTRAPATVDALVAEADAGAVAAVTVEPEPAPESVPTDPSATVATNGHVESTPSTSADDGETDDGPNVAAVSPDSSGEAQPRVDDQDAEPANRRRRRRGRDRDRGPDRDERGDEQVSVDPVPVEGLLDLRDDGYGFVRTKGYLPTKDDSYVSVKQVRQYGLRKGDVIAGLARPASRNEKNPALLRIESVNGNDPDSARDRRRFEDLTPLFPDEKLRLETPSDPSNMTARIVDLVAPIGKGQRGLVVSPPKAGKTTVLKQIVKSIETNNPEVHLMVLLVDERPEEVTDMRRWTKGEVVASTFDRPAEEHTMVAELAIERAKRMVEGGADVVVVLDGITRLARAYNLAAPATGRIMSGGVDSGALYPPKKFFGSARNVEEGGSLTILATALIETGSRMDEVIFEEFKGTGNMELRLDRRLAERRIYPAIDVDASSTRHEELLFDRTQLQQVWRVRRALNALTAEGASPGAALERLKDGMKTYRTNDEFLSEAAKTSTT